jgi:hypothetical protein
MEQRGLGFGGGAEFVLLVLASGFGFVLFPLGSAFSLVSLPLLPGLLFLTFGKCRSASWHTHPLIV